MTAPSHLSLTEQQGSISSSLAATLAAEPSAMRLRYTMGVLPVCGRSCTRQQEGRSHEGGRIKSQCRPPTAAPWLSSSHESHHEVPLHIYVLLLLLLRHPKTGTTTTRDTHNAPISCVTSFAMLTLASTAAALVFTPPEDLDPAAPCCV